MSMTEPMVPAQDIVVHHYRQILLLPLLLDWRREGEGDERANLPSLWGQWIRTLTEGGWQLTSSLPQASTLPGKFDDYSNPDPSYEEVVYFHPFARDLLFGDDSLNPDERVMLRFRRQDIRGMRVTLSPGTLADSDRPPTDAEPAERQCLFAVPRVEAYLCKPGIVILAVEVVWTPAQDVRRVALSDVMALQSCIRQLYPPYFYGDNLQQAGQCPASIAWLDGETADAGVIAESDFQRGREYFAKQVEVGAEPPVASHWALLLKPILPYRRQHETGPRFRQILDDRLPGLTYLSVSNSRLVSEGDFHRLAYCESGGRSPFAYSSDFVAGCGVRYTYDRYWRRTADEDGPYLTLDSRYLCSGFQFVAVGSQSNGFFNELICDHFRRHYFRLALVAHYQRAALLKFADELSEAIKMLKGLSPRQELDNDEFRRRVEFLQMTFLKFVSRAWFSEVSNQLQGQELFRWWSDLLANPRLFEEVQRSYQTMHAVLTEHDERKIARLGAVFAAMGAVLALVGIVLSAISFSG